MYLSDCPIIGVIFYCCVVGATIDNLSAFSFLKNDKRTSSNNASWSGSLNDWRSLLFPEGHNPLEDHHIIDSSSSSDEEQQQQESSISSNVFQTTFSNNHINEQADPTSVNTRVSRKTAEFFANELSNIVQNDWQGRGMESFNMKILQLNVSIYNLKIVEVSFPRIRFERPESNILHLIGSGGHAHIRGSYKSTYRTTRRGHVEATVYGFNIDLKLKFQRSQSRILYLIATMDCKPTISRINVEMQPFLLEEVEDAFKQHLWLSLQEAICSQAKDYVQQTDAKFQEFGNESPFDTKVDNV